MAQERRRKSLWGERGYRPSLSNAATQFGTFLGQQVVPRVRRAWDNAMGWVDDDDEDVRQRFPQVSGLPPAPQQVANDPFDPKEMQAWMYDGSMQPPAADPFGPRPPMPLPTAPNHPSPIGPQPAPTVWGSPPPTYAPQQSGMAQFMSQPRPVPQPLDPVAQRIRDISAQQDRYSAAMAAGDQRGQSPPGVAPSLAGTRRPHTLDLNIPETVVPQEEQQAMAQREHWQKYRQLSDGPPADIDLGFYADEPLGDGEAPFQPKTRAGLAAMRSRALRRNPKYQEYLARSRQQKEMMAKGQLPDQKLGPMTVSSQLSANARTPLGINPEGGYIQPGDPGYENVSPEQRGLDAISGNIKTARDKRSLQKAASRQMIMAQKQGYNMHPLEAQYNAHLEARLPIPAGVEAFMVQKRERERRRGMTSAERTNDATNQTMRANARLQANTSLRRGEMAARAQIASTKGNQEHKDHELREFLIERLKDPAGDLSLKDTKMLQARLDEVNARIARGYGKSPLGDPIPSGSVAPAGPPPSRAASADPASPLGPSNPWRTGEPRIAMDPETARTMTNPKGANTRPQIVRDLFPDPEDTSPSIEQVVKAVDKRFAAGNSLSPEEMEGLMTYLRAKEELHTDKATLYKVKGKGIRARKMNALMGDMTPQEAIVEFQAIASKDADTFGLRSSFGRAGKVTGPF